MATSDSDLALLTEHLGYPPVSLLDDIINSINTLAERALTSVEQGLLNQPPQALGFKPPPPAKPTRSSSRSAPAPVTTNNDSPADPSPEAAAAHHEISNGTHQLETLLCASIDRNFDKFELYVMQNILCLRPSEPREWIRLGHYEGLDLDSVSGEDQDDDESRPSIESVRRLRRRLQASQQLNAMLHAERARNRVLLDELRAVVGSKTGTPAAKQPAAASSGAAAKMELDAEEAVDLTQDTKPPFAFLHDAGGLAAGAADKPLETTTAFTLSQLQALRALSTSLRNVLPDLGGGGGEEDGEAGDSSVRKSWRRERLEYVESATRKHLEQARGLELGKDGEVMDGEWQGEGPGLARDEVEGLERVVGILGGAAGEGSKGDEMDES